MNEAVLQLLFETSMVHGKILSNGCLHNMHVASAK